MLELAKMGLAKTTETTIPNIKAKTRWSYLAVTASQIQHHLVSTLLGFHTLKLQKKNSNLELSA